MAPRPLAVSARPALAAALLAALAGAGATAAPAAYTPRPGALYEAGPSGRYRLGGPWEFRADRRDEGLRRAWFRPRGAAGWSRVRVPHAWNAGDESEDSMRGGVGWYRKRFALPSAALAPTWVVRFESVNYRARIWLNGRPVGRHEGAHLPFEVRLRGLVRDGPNTLVVRVDSRRRPTDFPPAAVTAKGQPAGGWWNYGGLLREVYLRRMERFDWDYVRVLPALPCPRCPATVEIRAALRNVTAAPRTVRVRATFAARTFDLGRATVPPQRVAILSRRVRVPRPRLWSPEDPRLYRVRLRAVSGGASAGYELSTGIRSVRRTSDGRLELNGRLVEFRGVGLHEDHPVAGFAIGSTFRRRLVDEAREVGATLLRAHYPLHPQTHELADRLGLLIWSEIPVYALKTRYLAQRSVRARALRVLARNVETHRNHPSVLVWSIANELSARPGPAQGDYIARAARLARALDPSRPVALAVAGYPSAGCQTEYAPLDVVGVNEYFGWYPGPGGQLYDRTKLSGYLDAVRACYPRQAIVVSEFGAEANREGPVEEKGTYAFQQDFIRYHLGVHDSKPWLSGSVYWTLREFRVRPGWEGGNPRPKPPLHQKGVIAYDGARKPAFADLQALFRATPPLGPPAEARGR